MQRNPLNDENMRLRLRRKVRLYRQLLTRLVRRYRMVQHAAINLAHAEQEVTALKLERADLKRRAKVSNFVESRFRLLSSRNQPSN